MKTLKLDKKYTKNYATEEAALKAAENVIYGYVTFAAQNGITLIIVAQEGRFFPVFHLQTQDAMLFAAAIAGQRFYVFN